MAVNTANQLLTWGSDVLGSLLGNGAPTARRSGTYGHRHRDTKLFPPEPISSMAITTTGAVYAWGNNSVGQPEHRFHDLNDRCPRSGNVTDAVQVSCGAQHADIALRRTEPSP